MDEDFLDGIDECFERLIAEDGSGTHRENSDSTASDPNAVIREIIESMAELSDGEKARVLAFIRGLQRQPELF